MFRTLVIAALLVFTGCTSIPTKSLQSYTAAFNAVQEPSGSFLVQFGQTNKKAKEFVAKQNKKVEGEDNEEEPYSAYPRSLTVLESSSELDNDVETMRRGLDVVGEYNAALVSLAEGKSVEIVGSAAKSLTTAIGNFIPIAGGIVSGVGALASELEKARLREEFKVAIKDGAPTVNKILTVITNNVDTHYDNNVLFADNSRSKTIKKITRQIKKLRSLFIAHYMPGKSFTSLKKRQTTLNQILLPISLEKPIAPVFPYILAFLEKPAGAGSAETGPSKSLPAGAYTIDVEVQINTVFEEISTDIKRYDAINNEMIALSKSGIAFKNIISTTQNALRALEVVDKQAPDLSQQVFELKHWAFLLKTHVEAILNTRSAAR